jgi:simple sugar transport system substrate-binding protein
MTDKRRTRRTGVLLAGLALTLAACTSQGGAQEEEGGGDAGGGQVADTERFTIAMITHEAPGDTFWDKIRAGAEDAAAKDNIELKYSNDTEAGRQATLIQNAVDSGVDAIAVTMSKPEPLTPAIQAAIDAGIPVVGFNSGINAWKEVGVLQYFGSTRTWPGRARARG